MTNIVNGVNVEQMRDTVRSINRDPVRAKETWKATTTWKGGGHVETQIREFTVEGDEPDELLGPGRAPNTVEAVVHALGACLAVSVVHHAAARGIVINALELDVTGELDRRGFLGLSDEVRPGYQNVTARCRIATDGRLMLQKSCGSTLSAYHLFSTLYAIPCPFRSSLRE